MELKKVLIIEDDKEIRDAIIAKGQVEGIEIQAGEPDDLDNLMAVPHQFQLVILDWFLYGESSDLARVCLTKIRKAYFIPMVIYTAELTAFTDEIEDVKKIFPEACLHARGKDEIDISHLLGVLTDWHNKTPARLSHQFRRSLVASIEEALYKLAEHSEDDLARGLKTLITAGDTDEIDIEHTVDVLLRLIGRAIYEDENFINEVKQTVEKLEWAPDKRKNIESRIKKLHMYYQPRDKFVRTGDIVKITIESEQKIQQVQGIILTPACDLAQPGKTRFLRLVLIRQKVDPTRCH